MQLSVRFLIRGNAAQDVPRSSQFRSWFVGAVWENIETATVVRAPRMTGVARVSRVSTASPALIHITKVVDQLVVDLILRLDLLLKAHDLIYKDPVCAHELEILLLQLLDLMLGRHKGIIENHQLLRRGEAFLGGLRFPRGRSFAPDVIQIMLAISAELWVFELPSLSSTLAKPKLG